MKIHWNQLKNLPVVTENGEKIGYVKGVSCDTDSHTVSHYVVLRSGLVSGLFMRDLLVAPVQVISVSQDKMIVKDTAVYEDKKQPKASSSLAFDSPAPKAEMSEIGE